MNINRSAQSSFKQCSFKNENHCEYFESLEQKLLEESEKLASFMRKSTVNEHSRKKLKLAASPARKTVPPFKVLKEQDKFSRTNTVKVEHPKQETTYLKRVKQLCSILRQPKVTFDETMKSPLKLPEKQRQQNDRKSVYNIHSLKEMPKQQPNKQKKQRSDLQKLQKSSKIYKLISDAQSLKDTISTQSCKSIKSIDQHLPKQKCKLDDLQVLKYLAEGKFGSVYLVRHKRTNFMCALKRIPFMMLGNDSKILTQRIRQIKIQSFLDHPNIVQLYSVFVEENDLYLLMELCYSGNLLNHLHAEGRFIEQKIRSVIKQICDAVEFMHDNDILHRDLKPENILFHESIVKICDFGWSVNSPLLRDTLCGTPLYSSPEIVQKQQYDNKIDIWNIGILTYQLLYGKVPFQIRSEEDLSKIIDDDIYFPRSKPASPQIKDFILRCLSKNPKQRFTIAKLVDHQFLNPSNLHQSV